MLDPDKLDKPRTKEEYAYEALRTAILHCNLKPGEKVLLGSLSEKLGISPIPVRAALQRLQSEGLVEIIPHTGTMVSEISPNQVAEVFLLLEVMECAAFESAAGKATEEELSHLRRLITDMDHAYASGAAETWSELNGQFHRYIAAITGMPMLIEFTGRVLDRWDRVRRWYLPYIVSQRMPASMQEHRKMVDLFAKREITSLLRLVAAHNRHARADYEKLIRQGA